MEENITKSPYDKRDYRYLKLPNGLRALLVSDNITEKASAALSVRIGSLSDPDEIPGLAHFCEHMLFLGTEKYPSENEYTEFVSHNGGTFNAYTNGEFTTFFFDVGCDSLKGALDRFAQFFIGPLFNADAKDREVNAVESENEKNMQVDAWRFQQVCKATCKSNHPYGKFATGNKYTLETKPQEDNIEVREELLKFHSTHYSSNVMCLVVIGKESLNELNEFVLELFSPIVNKNVEELSFPEPPYSENELQMWLEYVPVKDLRQLRLEFPLPDLMEYYDCDPSTYVAHLIGHEGSGSLLSHLKARGWCNILEAGPASGAKGFMFFSVNVDMTEEGEGHVEDIVSAVFQYLAMLREEGPKEWIFEECKSLDEIDFRFRDKQTPISYSRRLTQCLHDYPPVDVLCGGLLRTYRPDLIEMVLDKLRPQYARVGWLSQKFKGKTDSVERWYGSEYNSRKIDPALVESWKSVEPCPHLHLPKPNEFIPTDFSLVPPPVAEEMPKRPVIIKDTSLTKVWFKQDDSFETPKANLYFKISSPMAYKDPLCNSEMTLFVSLLVDDLKEYTYNAEMAGIEYKISNDVYGIKLRVGGYHHKQAILLSKLMKKMTHFVVDAKRFEIFKEIISRNLKNFRAEQPHTHAMYFCNVILESCAWTREELAEAIERVTCEMLQEYVLGFFSFIHLEALLHGNLSKQTCFELVDIVEEALTSGAHARPLPSPLELHRQVSLPDNTPCTFSIKNEVHQSYCIEFYLQVGLEDTKSNMLLELLSQILQEPCFNTLRTKEQLGYIVVSGLKAANGVQGFRVLVQSRKDSWFVERRVESFLRDAREILEDLSEESFEGHKKALSVKRSEKPKKLEKESMKYWSEILTQHYNFNRDEIEVACLMKLNKSDVIQFYTDHISPSASLRRKLTVHVFPENQNLPDSETDTGTGLSQNGNAGDEVDFDLPKPKVITDISKFKTGLTLFPALEPFIKTSL